MGSAVKRQLRRIATPYDRVVLMSHYPPLLSGLFPARVGAQAGGGSESLARFVEEPKPILIAQGHEHRWAGLSGRTASALVINPSRAGMVVVVDTDANHVAIDG